MSADPVALTRDLIRCPSVTPAEGGALAYLESVLTAAGFRVHRMTFHEPGAGDVEKGELFGRGAVDMKGGIACAVAAVLDHLAANGGKPRKDGAGSISFLITGDEEGI